MEKAHQEAKLKPEVIDPALEKEFLIREATAKQQEKRLDFIPDFDVDEVPPLE